MQYTLAFDVYGTLIDTTGVSKALKKMIPKKAILFMELWRNKQLEYSFRRGLMGLFVDFSVCTKDALEYCCTALKVDLSKKQKNFLMNEYKVLPAFADVKETLMLLKKSNHHLYAFSNGSHKAVSELLKNSGIIDYFDEVISVEEVNMFKPSPLVYQYFNDKTNSNASDSWLISGNSFDVIGAASYGMKTVWVQRSAEIVIDPWEIQPTAIISNLRALKAVL